MKITLQTHCDNTWQDFATLLFLSEKEVLLEYDIDYTCNHLNKINKFALSCNFPVSLDIYKGPIPGFILDLIPQGKGLRRILAKYNIIREDHYAAILPKIPLSSPGNLRVKEAWLEIEENKKNYNHQGFTLEDILQKGDNFLEYMELHHAPIGGITGAAGGALKFMLRKDEKGFFHSDGWLCDEKTAQCYIVKYPFSDGKTDRSLNKAEVSFQKILKTLPFIKSFQDIEIHNDILFLPRFDRVKKGNIIEYYGLESFYSLHGINIHGMSLYHEDNLRLIKKFCTSYQKDAVDYLFRDLFNQLVENSDNHGRNNSLIKIGESISLAPAYDVTAMRFFNEPIVELTTWRELLTLSQRVEYLIKEFRVSKDDIKEKINLFRGLLDRIDLLHKNHDTPKEFLKFLEDKKRNLQDQIESIKL